MASDGQNSLKNSRPSNFDSARFGISACAQYLAPQFLTKAKVGHRQTAHVPTHVVLLASHKRTFQTRY
jgi:hypothetical protein